MIFQGPAQIAGCITGAVAANAMFALSAVSISAKHRACPAHLLAEVIATLGLLLVIFALARTGRTATAPATVGAYIGAAYYTTRQIVREFEKASGGRFETQPLLDPWRADGRRTVVRTVTWGRATARQRGVRWS